MFSRFENLSIQLKASAAAAVLLICLLVLGANAYLTSMRSTAGLRTLSQDLLVEQQTIAALAGTAVATHMKIFRYVSWASTGVSDKLMKPLYAEIIDDLRSVADRIATLAGRDGLPGSERDELLELSAKWRECARKAQDTIEVGQTDAPMATMMLTETDDAFQAVDTDLQGMSRSLEAAENELGNRLYAAAERNKLIIVIGTLGGFLVSMFVAVVVGRSIVGPVRLITDVMQRLSGGETDVEIGHRGRRDEIGQMVEAIDVFRGNIIEQRRTEQVLTDELRGALDETRHARDAAERALDELKTAQASLVQAQKMAALGQLTAGIAHEIKNPLNFVNNFASLSSELLGELKEEVTPALGSLADDKREAVDETIELLTGNLDKIVEHGQRADNIVKSMLEHSRGVSGERRAVDLNALVEEALNLAYHGARAQDTAFNVALERDYAPALAPVELAPQEMTRVFLNLIGNGFYAADKRAKANGDAAYRPTLYVATREEASAVVVQVRDNGTGIPPDIRDKLFQPFFTTKPTGEGTGLGLSISYDIVTQQHGGTIEVASEEGAYTEFTVRLPRHESTQGTSGGG